MDLFQSFSSKENLKKAFAYLKDEADESSLSLDPIWRPSISAVAQLGDEFFEALQDYLRQDKYQPDKADFVYADKDNMGVRPICVFSVVDRIVFQALLNPWILGNIIDKKLYRSCLGNRVLGKEKYLKPYKKQWIEFCDKQVEAFNKKLIWRVEFDIRTYYEDIHIDTLLKVLKEDFQIHDERLLTILKNQLEAWSEKPTGCGIPQGANASHLLANAYLYKLDTFFDDLKSGGDFEYFRYVDDIVVMAKSADKINHSVAKAGLSFREFNLTFNDKTKIGKLKNTKSIEELKFYSPYGQLNETSQQRVEKISKRIPIILRKIARGSDVKKTDISGLKYYLKAEAGLGNSEVLDNLIALIPKKPSLIFLISRYLSFYLSDINIVFNKADKKLIRSKYEKIWKTYNGNSLTGWTKFWLLKVLSTPSFAKDHEGFQSELNRIIADPDTNFLRPLAFFYKAYTRAQIDPLMPLGFTSDDIKRHIRNAKTQTEKAIYYYFSVYLSGVEENEIIKELVYEALQSKSPEIQTMGLFLIKNLYHLFEPTPAVVDNRGVVTKWNVNSEREITGELSRIYFKFPPPVKPKAERETATEDDYLTFEGKIAKDKFASFIGMSKPRKEAKYSKIIANKLKYYPESGDTEYKTAVWQFKGKARAFLTILHGNKNMNFNIEDIKKYCNPLVIIQRHKFRDEKDTNDTLREIRFRLKASKGELFPIFKQERGWIWLEK
ncbi:MAG: reverse transcriptase domain-containing protein [Minisyncoccia bacterium]